MLSVVLIVADFDSLDHLTFLCAVVLLVLLLFMVI